MEIPKTLLLVNSLLLDIADTSHDKVISIQIYVLYFYVIVLVLGLLLRGLGAWNNYTDKLIDTFWKATLTVKNARNREVAAG
jgi:hypothetical protein